MPNKLTTKSAAKKAAPAPAMPKAMADDDRKWRAEDAMRTLMRAEEYKRDSKLMADVKKLAADQAAKMQAVCGTKGKK